MADALLLGAALTAPLFELVDLGSFPAMLEGGSTSVSGELYAVGPDTLARLDELEEHPVFYRRTPVPLSDGSTAEAYLLSRSHAAKGLPVASGDWRSRGGAAGGSLSGPRSRRRG